MLENSNKHLIGSILRSIRIEKDIPIKKIAYVLKVSEPTISQIETSKNKPTIEKINLISNACGCSFNFEIKRNEIIDKVIFIYKHYTNLDKNNLNLAIKKVKDNTLIRYSYARFEYYLILYMDAIINQKNENVNLFKKIIELGKLTFNMEELSIYYDIRALEQMYLKNSIKALEYLDISKSYNCELLMNSYHYCSIYLNLGYYSLAQRYIDKSMRVAIKEVSFERLCYLILNQGVLFLNTGQYESAMNLNLELLIEATKRKNSVLEYCVLSNLCLVCLMQKKFNEALKFVNLIDEKYMDDYDLILYQTVLYFFIQDFASSKRFIKLALKRKNVPQYYRSFFTGMKYLMDAKNEKAILCFEKCYNYAIVQGEVDRATLDLKLLNYLYLKFDLIKKMQQVKEIQEKFYEMSFASEILVESDVNIN